MTISIEEMLGIDRTDPMQQRAQRQVRADWNLIGDLVAARESVGLTQAEVAALMGISQSAVARIESRARDPHLSTLRRYAIAVGVTVDHRVVSDPVDRYRPRALRGRVMDDAQWRRELPSFATASAELARRA